MLTLRSHAWTPAQKSLIVSAVLFGIAAFCTAVYSYERYHRGPSENALYGTWQDSDFFEDEPVYFEFHPDHTFFIAGVSQGELNPFVGGTWYAGGPNIYLRFAEGPFEGRRPTIAHIVRISKDEIRIKWFPEPASRVTTWKKTLFPSPPRNASNKSLEATAGRSVESL